MSQQDHKPNQEQQEELDALEKLRLRMNELYEAGSEAFDPDTMKKHLEKARDEMLEIGEHSKEIITKASHAMQKDMITTIDSMKPNLDQLSAETEEAFNRFKAKSGNMWNELAEESEKAFTVWRDRSGNLAAEFARNVGEWSQSLGQKLDDMLIYHTGESSQGGDFRCVDCGQEITLKNTGHLPPCPKCHHTEFRRA